jgi:large subunit ribosomal protein L6
MSRIGKKPVAVPKGVTATIQGLKVSVKGPKGELARELPPFIQGQVKDGQIELSCSREGKEAMAIYGTTRSLVANMVVGVHAGYSKDLEIQGVGFKAAQQGQKIVLTLGYSHPIEFAAPAGITLKVADGTAINISGPDKQLVGQVSARIKAFCPPEPYKGKGIRFKGEHVRRKVGKTVA